MSSQAQNRELQRVEDVPQFRDFVYVTAPEGFSQKLNKGNFNRFLLEYVPRDESVMRWSKMLTVSAFPAARLPSAADFADKFFSRLGSLCVPFSANRIDDPSLGEVYQVTCRIKDGLPLTGGAGSRWEAGLYRYFKTSEALFAVHLAWHGDDAAVSDESARRAFFEEAKGVIKNVRVCDLKSGEACEGLDFDLGTKGYQPLRGRELPCKSDPARDCLAQVQIEAERSSFLPGPKKDKRGLYPVDLTRTDLSKVRNLNAVVGRSMQALKDGVPGIAIILRLGDPKALPTEAERLTAGTAASVIRGALIQTRTADPDSVEIRFLNFLPPN